MSYEGLIGGSSTNQQQLDQLKILNMHSQKLTFKSPFKIMPARMLVLEIRQKYIFLNIQ